jgi:soluble lytic murein transglycosylase-like protein
VLSGIAIFGVLFTASSVSTTFENPVEDSITLSPGPIESTQPPCIQMYNAIHKHAKEEGIPLKYAFGIANTETGYKGPFHWEYNPGLISSAGAVGPMQIMYQYAHPYADYEFTREELRTNIDLNVMISMRMLKKLKKKHGDWKLAFGAYNTGRPCINGYAEKVYNYVPGGKTFYISGI